MLSDYGAGEDSRVPLTPKYQNSLKGNQPWIFLGRTDAETEAPIHWPPHENSQLIGKDPDARKDWRQKEKRATKDETVGWHHQFNGRELGQTPGDGEDREGWGAAVNLGSPRVGHDLVTEQQQHWEIIRKYLILKRYFYILCIVIIHEQFSLWNIIQG